MSLAFGSHAVHASSLSASASQPVAWTSPVAVHASVPLLPWQATRSSCAPLHPAGSLMLAAQLELPAVGGRLPKAGEGLHLLAQRLAARLDVGVRRGGGATRAEAGVRLPGRIAAGPGAAAAGGPSRAHVTLLELDGAGSQSERERADDERGGGNGLHAPVLQQAVVHRESLQVRRGGLRLVDEFRAESTRRRALRRRGATVAQRARPCCRRRPMRCRAAAQTRQSRRGPPKAAAPGYGLSRCGGAGADLTERRRAK